MFDVRFIGLLVSLTILLYILYKRRQGSYRRLDLVIGLVIGISIGVLSVFPAATNILADIFGLRNRLFATLVFTNIVMFGLFLYVLNKANRANRQIGDLVRALAKAEYRKIFSLEKKSKLIFIVMPAYNEEKAIKGVLEQIPRTLLGYQVHLIVVVDGADDNTEEIVRRKNYMVASHAMNRGQGDTLRTGFEIALKQGADIVVTMDADGQHRPQDLPKLLGPIIEGEADYVMGSRFLGVYEDSRSMRHLGILLFNLVINTLTRLRITDCTNGFRAISGSKLSRLQLREDRFNAPELIMEAHRHGLRIKEVPVTIKRRTESKSKKPPGLRYPLGFLRTIVQTWLR